MTALRTLRAVEPSTECLIRNTITAMDEARKVVARCEAILGEQGRVLMAEKYPNERGYLRPTEAQIRHVLAMPFRPAPLPSVEPVSPSRYRAAVTIAGRG